MSMTGNDLIATRRPVPFAGLGMTMCALAAAGAAVAAGLLVGSNTSWLGWATIPAIWLLLAALLLSGLALVARPRHGDVAAVVAFVCSVQLIGGGLAASRDWFNVSGATGIPFRRLPILMPLTAVVLVTSTVACCLALALVKQHAEAVRREWWRPPCPEFTILGSATAVALPLLLAGLSSAWQLTTLGQVALAWSLPWGCGLALAAWLDRRLRRAALTAVSASALGTVV
ncbi:hypothetical protein OHA21_15800 [Actinoplanes sp. NBC_00393]|uniref:hypothetical protein n=1 Tax=Actinoplanes sp. NBC_00393 TaxID=2975953 RepID=UPI002E1AF7EA